MLEALVATIQHLPAGSHLGPMLFVGGRRDSVISDSVRGVIKVVRPAQMIAMGLQSCGAGPETSQSHSLTHTIDTYQYVYHLTHTLHNTHHTQHTQEYTGT